MAELKSLLSAIAGTGKQLPSETRLDRKYSKDIPLQGKAGATRRRMPDLAQRAPGKRDVTLPVPAPSRPAPQTFDEAEGFGAEIGHNLQTIKDQKTNFDYRQEVVARYSKPPTKKEQEAGKLAMGQLEALGWNKSLQTFKDYFLEEQGIEVGIVEFLNWLDDREQHSEGRHTRDPYGTSLSEDQHMIDIEPNATKQHDYRRQLETQNRTLQDVTGLPILTPLKYR